MYLPRAMEHHHLLGCWQNPRNEKKIKKIKSNVPKPNLLLSGNTMKSEEKNPALAPLALWLDICTVRWLCASIFLVTLLYVSAAPTLADVFSPLIWDCWIGDDASIGIYCIHDRTLLDQQDIIIQLYLQGTLSNDPGDKLEAALLDQIYERFLGARTKGLSEFVRTHASDLRNGAVWVIPIWSYPSESSWEKNWPARLVRAGLCPMGTPCTVILNKPTR